MIDISYVKANLHAQMNSVRCVCWNAWPVMSSQGTYRNGKKREELNSCRKGLKSETVQNWEELSWAEKWRAQVKRNEARWGIHRSSEDVRLHPNSYRQTLSLDPIVYCNILPAGNFRHPPRAGFTVIIKSQNIFFGSSLLILLSQKSWGSDSRFFSWRAVCS